MRTQEHVPLDTLPPLDSLPPHVLSNDLDTIRPSRKELENIKKRRMGIAFLGMHFFFISAAAFIYVLFFYELADNFRLYSSLLALLVFISSLSSLSFNYMMLPKGRKKR
ncbi:hypothetical protein KKG46_04620 [Patescibacteria group bacterium]|nr:hypothetical protein [Patescibacteria group bacterium]